MAQSYRGLTIQIGGDTTKLNAALKSANQAVSSTESGLRKLSNALKLDPTSLKASQLQVSAFAENASNAATRMVTLNDAMRQVGDQMKVFNGSAQSIRSMADGWDNVSMKAAQTREYYAKLTDTIATSYSGLTKLHSEASKVAGETLSKNLADSVANMDLSKIIGDIKEMQAAFGSTKGLNDTLKALQSMEKEYQKLSEEAKKYQEILDTQNETEYVEADINGVKGVLPVVNDEFVEAAANLQVTSARMDELRTKTSELVESLAKFKGVGDVFKFDNKNVDLPSLATALMQIVKAEKMTIEEADAMYDSFEKMKNMFTDAWQNVQTANAVESFTDLEAEAARAEAKVAAVVEQLVRAAKSDATKGIAGLEEKLKSVADAGSNASTRLKQALDIIQNAMKNGGKADEAQMTNAMRAYSDAVSAASEKVRILEEEISKLKEERSISYFAGMSTEGLVAYAEEAEQDYREMATAVETYEAALNRVNQELLTIQANNPNDYEDNEQYKEYIQQAEAYNKILRIARIEATSAKEAFTDMSKALTLRDKEHELQAARSELEKMSNINMKVDVDVSALDGLKKALEAMSKETFSADGFSELRENVASAATSMADAEKRYKALNEVAKKDPTNSQAVKMATDALKQAIIATNQHIKAMKKELAAIPSDRVNKAALAAGTAATEYNKAKQKVDDYVKSLRDVNQRIEDLTKERKEISPVTPEAQKRVDELDKALEELKQRRDALAAAGDAAFDSLAIADNTRRVQEHGTAVQKDTEHVRELKRELMYVGKQDGTPKVDEAAFVQVVGRIADSAKRMASEIVQSSNEVDAAFRDMRKTVNGTERDFDKLMETAIEYSQHNFSSADTMLEMQALGGQLGVATEDLEQFGRIASNLDIATDIDAETVALKLGQISNVLQLDINDMQGFADALVRLGNNMPAQESAIMAVAQRFGAVAATASFSGEEVLAWSAAIAATGQRSEAAATAISNTVSGIEQAVANGGSSLKQFAAIAGMSADEFVKAWEESPTEVLRSFINGLRILKDSDKSAVAALENMGITGVRQQQTLLALTQTINTLDDALSMSSSAWHGISDQWGQSGDAANEAAKKAEGFSGALAIMQNNAQNLAASMGDGLIPFMNLASSALELLTDILNMTPAPIKTIVAGLGGLSIAFSTIAPMAKVFSSGISGALASLAKTSVISTAITDVMNLATGMEFTTAEALEFASAFSGPVLLGIGAVVAALVIAIDAINEYCKQQETYRQSTEGMTDAVLKAQEAYNGYTGTMSYTITTLDEMKAKTDEIISNQAALAESMSEKWTNVGESAAEVDYLSQKIVELSEKETLTRAEQEELNAAVSTFNEITGSGVEILDKNTGKLNESKDAILDTAEAWKQMAIAEAAYDMYRDVVKQLIEDQMAYDEALKNHEAAEEKVTEAEGNREKGIARNEAAMAKARLESESWAKEMETLQGEIDSANETLDTLFGFMSSGDKAAAEMRQALVDAGESTEEFDKLTSEEVRQIAKNFGTGVDDILRGIEQIKAAEGSYANATSDALEKASKSYAKAKASEYKANADAIYNTTKAGLDKEYNELKASLDASYNAQKKSFDAAYKQAQKAYDSQYKQAQKAYENDYNALKKKLDNELNALKKANEKRLKALKDANDDEVDAFKKATDARLKEMEREYKAKLKMLELEYGQKDSGIDEQIKALEAETEAEKQAIKEREREDKKAELQSAVNKAKSRRKRAEAEKALNDYIQEIESERNEESRKTEVERLKEQKDALKDELSERKEQLKEQYDAEVEAYKEKRAAELQALQDANQAEYDKLKEQLDAQEEARKEANDTRLQNLKDFQQAQLEAMKESQQAQLEAMKESQQAQLEAIKASNTAQLQEQKAKNTKELQDLKAAQKEKYEAIKNGDLSVLDESEFFSNSLIKKSYDTSKGVYDNVKSGTSNMLSKLKETMGIASDTGDGTGEGYKTGVLNGLDNTYSGAKDKLDDTLGVLSKFATDAGLSGGDAGSGYVSGYESGSRDLDYEVEKNIDSIYELFNKASFAYSSGFELVDNLRQGMENARIYLENTVQGIAGTIYSYFHHSTPDKGPLRNDDKWGGDLIQNLIDGMQDKEHDLRRQVERMADVVEDGFNPSMSLDAAYEAIDTINKGHTSAASLSAGGKAGPTVNLTLNMNLSGMSVRDDTDIEKFAELVSQKMAAQTARQIAGRLG